MPILDPTNPLLAAVPATFRSALPDSTLTAKGAAPLFAALTRDAFASGHMRNATTLAAQLARDVGISSGWPQSDLGELSTLVSETLRGLSSETSARMFASNVIPQVAKIMDAALESLVGIPIIGWIVQVGLNTWRIVEAARKAPPPKADALALGYDKADDEVLAQAVIDRARDRDVTSLFLPPQGAFDWRTLAYTNSGAADGVAWGQLDGGGDRLGILPGVADIAGYWQSPRNMLGSTRWAGRESIVSQGRLAPSVIAIGGQVWMAASMRPMLGRIAFAELADAWSDYGARLLSFANKQGDKGRGAWMRGQVRAAWEWYDPRTKHPHYNVRPDSLPGGYRHPQLDSLIRYAVDRAWATTLSLFSATEMSAYVERTDPFFRGQSAGVVSAWQDARRALLKRKDVVDVDPSMVRDADYRSAVIASQATWAGTPQRTPAQKRSSAKRIVKRDKQHTPFVPTAPGGGIGAAVAVVLAGGAIWYAATR